MLRFNVYRDSSAVQQSDLAGSYVFGADGIPILADIKVADGQICCIKRIPGACGLAMLWEAGKSGCFLLPTTRLPERSKPYNLNVELARARMMQIAQKCEDWGLFDYAEAEPLNKDFNAVRRKFIESLKCAEPAAAAALADEALSDGVTLGEKIALFHAEIFLERRKASTSPASRASFSCMVDLLSTAADYHDRLREISDFVSIPTPWKHTEPEEKSYQYPQLDEWVNWAARAGKPIHAGALLSFEPAQLPEWLHKWDHDYETLRDLIYEHIQRIVKRYERHVRLWKVVSGIHAHNNFNLNFEQIMELTRMSCLFVKKLAPHSQVMIELTMPWGEYYARNQRTIPPLLYADMAVQSDIKFDTFGVQFCMGVPEDGFYVRDLMQISSLLDEFIGLGKPVHITACQVPSGTSPDAWDAWGGKASASRAGRWHAEWSPQLQAEWLQAFFRIGVSKPFVESICWRDLADYEGHYIPHGGLCHNNMKPKLAYKELRNFKASLMSDNAGTTSPTDDAAGPKKKI